MSGIGFWPAWLFGAAVGWFAGWRLGLLAGFLLAAVYTDLVARRIPNKLVFPGAVVGVLCSWLLPGGPGWLSALQGLGIGLAALLPLYLLRAMGAGDVKLMAMVGAFLGAGDILGAMLGTLVAGGVMSLAVVVRRRAMLQLIDNLKVMMVSGFSSLVMGQVPATEVPAASVGKLPYALAIAVGTFAYLVWQRYWG